MAKKAWTAVPNHPGIFREGPEGTFVIRLRRTGPDGKEVTKSERIQGDTRIEVVALRKAELMVQLMAEIRGEVPPPPSPKPEALRFSGYVESWLEQKEPTLRASTLTTYVDVLGHHLVPFLGEIPVAEIRREDLQRWSNWMVGRTNRFERPYAQSVMDKAARVLCVVIRDAAADHDFDDPTRRVKWPKSKAPGRPNPGNFLDGDRVKMILAAVKEHAPQWEEEVTCLLLWGLRPSELYALTWSKIDEAEKTGLVVIDQAVVRGILGSTKSGSPRSVPMVPELVDMLRRRRQRMIRDQHRGLALGLVFPNQDGGYRGPNAARHMLQGLALKLKDADLGISLYDFRRTFNNWARQDTDRIVLRSMMGHMDEAMTERYAEGTLEEKKAAVGVVIRKAGLRIEQPKVEG